MLRKRLLLSVGSIAAEPIGAKFDPVIHKNLTTSSRIDSAKTGDDAGHYQRKYNTLQHPDKQFSGEFE